MDILITAPNGPRFSDHFPPSILQQLQEMGKVERNPFDRALTHEELAERIADVDILITHWGTPQVDADILAHAPRLRLLAHAAGSVAQTASEACYERGLPVISANSVMARYVAEAALGYLIAATHRMTQMDRAVHAGQWRRMLDEQSSLFGAQIGLIGLGSVGRCLLELLRPFDCRVMVYDPYLRPDALEPWPFATCCDFDTAMRQPIVSIHASKTPETWHMINARALSLMPDGGILLNTARGSLIDSEALASELFTGRIYAILDVYEDESDPHPAALFESLTENTLLQPHMAAAPAKWNMTQAIVEELRRFLRGEPLTLEVPLAQYRLMTQEC